MKTFPFLPSYPTRAAALKAAKALCSMLKKPAGWKPHLHNSEPLPQHRKHGVWYMCLRNGPMELNVNASLTGHPTFWTLLGSRMDQPGMGNPAWTVDTSFRDPNKAIATQVWQAQRVFIEMKRVDNHIALL